MRRPALFPVLLLAATLAASPAQARRTPADGSASVHLELIQQMQQQGAWFASLAHIQAYRQQYGQTPALQLAEADALRQTGQPGAAADLYRQLLRSPLQAAALNGLGLIEAQAGQLAGAIDKLRRASALDPLNVAYLGDLGYALLLSGDVAGARLPLAQALELAPRDGRVVANAAVWHLVDGNPARAEALMVNAALPEASRQQVMSTALELRARLDALRTVEHTPAPSVSDIVAASRSAPSAAEAVAAASGTVTAPASAPSSPAPAKAAPAASPVPPPAAPASLPSHAPVLEQFSSSTQQGSSP